MREHQIKMIFSLTQQTLNKVFLFKILRIEESQLLLFFASSSNESAT